MRPSKLQKRTLHNERNSAHIIRHPGAPLLVIDEIIKRIITITRFARDCKAAPSAQARPGTPSAGISVGPRWHNRSHVSHAAAFFCSGSVRSVWLGSSTSRGGEMGGVQNTSWRGARGSHQR